MQENTLKNAQGNGRKSHGGTCKELKGDKEGTRNSWGTHGVGCHQGIYILIHIISTYNEVSLFKLV